MDVREKLVELLWEYDQMRMMRMSIEECADRLIQNGLTVRKCENDTKCSDLAICLDKNAKEKTERIVDLMTSFYGVDPGYYGVEAYPLASHLIAHGVTVQDWISVKDRLPDKDGTYLIRFANKSICNAEYENKFESFGYWLAIMWDENADWYPYVDVTHWMPLPEPPKE